MRKPFKSTKNVLVRKGEQILDSEGRDILNLACEEGFRVSGVSERLGLTVREFEGALDRSFGVRPKELFRHHRAVKARRMIQEGVDLKKVAKDLSFRHYSHFATEMKKFYGLPPVQLQAVLVRQCQKG